MRVANKQESEGGVVGSAGHREACIAALLASPQPEEVHAASALCLPGVEEFSEDRLPWLGRSFGGLPIAGRDAPAGQRSSLHDVAKGGAALAGCRASQMLARRDGPRTLGTQATRATDRDRLDRPGVECCQRLLRQASRACGNALEKGSL